MPIDGDYEPSALPLSRQQVADFEANDGRGDAGNNPAGAPIVILTSVGATTGKVRKNPVMRVEHDGRYAIVASLGGADANPAWYRNVKSHPHVELQDGADKRDYIAREVDGEEYRTWFDRAVTVWPDYAEYQKKTARKMPIFVLEEGT